MLLAHERGHNLGFRHSNGIMSYAPDDADPDTPLADETKTIAEHTDGLEILDWGAGVGTLKTALSLWREGAISLGDLRYCLSRWREGSARDVVCTNEIASGLDTDGLLLSVLTGGIYRPANRDFWDAWL
jgi:hypothetical protein